MWILTDRRTVRRIIHNQYVNIATVIMAYAITNLFFTKGQTPEFFKKQIFQFDLDTGMNIGEAGPGDSFSVSHVVTLMEVLR